MTVNVQIVVFLIDTVQSYMWTPIYLKSVLPKFQFSSIPCCNPEDDNVFLLNCMPSSERFHHPELEENITATNYGICKFCQ